jgi:hypothetical protein
MVFKTGWPLSVVDALPESDYREFFEVRDGLMKAKIWQYV